MYIISWNPTLGSLGHNFSKLLQSQTVEYLEYTIAKWQRIYRGNIEAEAKEAKMLILHVHAV